LNKNHKDSLKKWKKDIEASKERKYNFDTVSGKKNELLYFPDELNSNYNQKLGFPGQYLIHKRNSCKFI